MSGAVLQVRDLVVDFKTPQGLVRGVDGVDLTVERGEFVGIVGESGSGKSVTALTVAGLLDRRAAIVRQGQISLSGTPLLELSERELRRIRGARVGMVFQDPLGSLNPAYTIGWQVAEAIRLHRGDLPRRQVREEVVALLDAMGIAEPERAFSTYPHEYSGGMRQRVMIACALANTPELVFADEPTTALDVTIQAQVLELLQRIRRERGVTVVLISHDLGVVAEVADRVVVMYGGRVVETGPTVEVLDAPQHPYTAALLRSVPGRRPGRRLQGIPGRPEVRLVGASGPACVFQPRCETHVALGRPAACVSEPPPAASVSGRRTAACHFPRAAGDAVGAAAADDADGHLQIRASDAGEAPLLEVRGLAKEFEKHRRLLGGARQVVRAVDDVSFSVAAGETLALVGESGSGKTTTSRIVAGLVPPSAGDVLLEGALAAPVVGARTTAHRRAVQMVFQDPFASVNPRMRVGEIVAEPLRTIGTPRPVAKRRVDELLELVRLPRRRARQFPHELSGGERQRVCIARALALEPRLLVLDEPVSSLDVSIQAQVLNLLQDVQATLGLAFLFISHDLGVVRHVATRIAVMKDGRIVELAPTDEIFERPRHPYTRTLLDAIPDPARRRPVAIAIGEKA